MTEETNVADLKEEALEFIELTLGDGQESGRAVLLGQILSAGQDTGYLRVQSSTRHLLVRLECVCSKQQQSRA